MPLSAQRDRVIGDASLYLLQSVVGFTSYRCTLRLAQFLSLLPPEVGFLLVLGLGVGFSFVFDDTLRSATWAKSSYSEVL